MDHAFPNESTAYRAARDRLNQQEIELRRTMEAVAVARRSLPLGGEVPDDYVFEGASGPVRMSELFSEGKDALVVYSFMYGPEMDGPCPSCSAFLDSLDGAAVHAGQHLNLVIVAKSPLPRMLAAARERGWSHLRFLSSSGNAYNRDYFGEAEDGSQLPMLNVFQKKDGVVRHFWGSELMFLPADPGQDSRHNGTLDLFWNLVDLTPGVRSETWQIRMSDQYPN